MTHLQRLLKVCTDYCHAHDYIWLRISYSVIGNVGGKWVVWFEGTRFADSKYPPQQDDLLESALEKLIKTL